MYESTVFESLFWLLICLSAIAFCIVLMLRTWINYSRNPIVTTISMANPIWRLPFPGITICNNNKVYQPHAEVLARILTENGFNINQINKFFSSLVKLIRPGRVVIDNNTAIDALNALGYNVEDLMYYLMQPCNSLLVRCAWLGQLYNCSKIFKTVKSREGFCCAFNYHFDLTKKYSFYNHSLEDPLTYDDDVDDFGYYNTSGRLPGVENIQHAPGAGRDLGLSVALNIEGNTYKESARPYVGASILLHDPVDYPDVSIQVATVQPGQVSEVAVTGTGIKSSYSMKELPLQKRLCLFDDEVAEQNNYSFQTCIAKCAYKRIQKYCGCLPFYYPYEHEGVRTCFVTDVECILARRRRLSDLNKSIIEDCNCLPQCIDKSYDIFAEAIEMKDVEFNSEISYGIDIYNMSLVYVFFRDVTYLEYHRQNIMTWDGLLASFGGIFGLCMGGSVMSLVELLYHFTMEIFNLRKRRRGQSHKTFPPASEMFLSASVENPRMDRSTKNDSFEKRVFVVCNQLSLRHRSQNNVLNSKDNIVKFYLK